MQKLALSLSMIVLLSGCASSGTHHMVASSSLQDKKEAEAASWTRLKDLSASECHVSPLPPAPDEAVEISTCVSKLVDQYVMPNAVAPQILISSRTEAMDLAKDYAAGKMSPIEYKQQSENRLRKYQKSLAYYLSESADGQSPSG